MRMSPLGWWGSGQRRNTQSSWPSQVTWPGMSSAFSGEPQAEQVTMVITEATTLSIEFILQNLQHQHSPDTIGVSAEIHTRIPDTTAQMKRYPTCNTWTGHFSNLPAWSWRRRTLRRCSVGPVDCRRECLCGRLWTAAGQWSAAHVPSLTAPQTQTLCLLAPPQWCCCYQRLGEEGQCCCWCAVGCGAGEWSWLLQRDPCGDDLVAWRRRGESWEFEYGNIKIRQRKSKYYQLLGVHVPPLNARREIWKKLNENTASTTRLQMFCVQKLMKHNIWPSQGGIVSTVWVSSWSQSYWKSFHTQSSVWNWSGCFLNSMDETWWTHFKWT